MTVRDEIAESLGETGTRRHQRPGRTWNSTSRSWAASLTADIPLTRMPAGRSCESAIAVEVFMN